MATVRDEEERRVVERMNQIIGEAGIKFYVVAQDVAFAADVLARKAEEFERCHRNSEALRQSIHNRPWWDKLADRVAFLLMDVAAWVDRDTWTQQSREEREGLWGRLESGTVVTVRHTIHDGWRPGRYV